LRENEKVSPSIFIFVLAQDKSANTAVYSFSYYPHERFTQSRLQDDELCNS